MRIPALALVITALCLTAQAAPAAEARSSYDVRLLGLPVGQLRLAAREDGAAYAVSSTFATTGLARIVDASFRLSAQGRITAGGLAPSRYDEQIDTGDRRSTAQLSYASGVPRITGGTVAAKVAEDPDALDPRAQKGSVDPLTALYGVLRGRPAKGICRYSVIVFDGARRAALVMSGRRDAGDLVTCTGAYTRLAGFSASEMKRQSVYSFSITYAPAGGVMQPQSLSVRSGYGTAELTRK
ncbi:DUF3108 domain-containing protein [Roseovarius sp. M141]|uniref:DUF3108 domain-containing protein n=1 Tax=Roseovarius sp. M141 TaxID=2583806 RepID=UPI0020CF4EAE|nr:DUF3108 domain-containing protein [Roseovarius sp. M141]MCQ0093652.1 DUF3108 domain-containing protein [Roseovarius sp. M141]